MDRMKKVRQCLDGAVAGLIQRRRHLVQERDRLNGQIRRLDSELEEARHLRGRIGNSRGVPVRQRVKRSVEPNERAAILRAFRKYGRTDQWKAVKARLLKRFPGITCPQLCRVISANTRKDRRKHKPRGGGK